MADPEILFLFTLFELDQFVGTSILINMARLPIYMETTLNNFSSDHLFFHIFASRTLVDQQVNRYFHLLVRSGVPSSIPQFTHLTVFCPVTTNI